MNNQNVQLYFLPRSKSPLWSMIVRMDKFLHTCSSIFRLIDPYNLGSRLVDERNKLQIASSNQHFPGNYYYYYKSRIALPIPDQEEIVSEYHS